MPVLVFVEAEKSHTWGVHISEAGAELLHLRSNLGIEPRRLLKSDRHYAC